MKKLIIIQTVTPDYRAIFFKNIKKALNEKFELYSGDYYFETTVKSSDQIIRNQIKNHFLFKRRLLFQTGIWHLIFKNDIVVTELNPRIISNWMIVLIRWLFKKETYVWGHAWGRSGISSKRDFFRNILRKLSSGVIVYTNKQKEELQIKMPRKLIFSAPNALISSKEMITNHNSNISDIIYVGRLVTQKKPLFIIKAFEKAQKFIASNTKLLIVGDGSEFNVLKNYTLSNNLEKKVIFKGHVCNYNELKKLYSSSLFSVSPGYIGLSVTQSFGFGVPILVSKNENHSPEIEAVDEGFNAVYFNTNDIDDCVEKILYFYEKREYWLNQRVDILERCKSNYSIENMSNIFINLVK